MSAGLILAAAAMAQVGDASAAAPPAAQPAPAYGPATPAPVKVPGSGATGRKDCSPNTPDPQTGAIVVCVVRPNGYRIDPDIMAARNAKRRAQEGGPPPPERYANTGGPVGPQYGCMGPECINLLGVALTAAQMAGRLAKGQEIGSMFRTDPQMSEYQYYQQAKKAREQAEVLAGDRAYAATVEGGAAEPEGEGVRD